jgi:chromosome segregation ATPase
MKAEIFSGIGSFLTTNPLAGAWRRLRVFIEEMKRRAEDIEQEIAALRARVDDLDAKYTFANKLNEDAKRVADKDNALSEKVASVTKQLTEIDHKFTAIDHKFTAIDEKLTAKVEEIVARLPPATGWKRVMRWALLIALLLLLCWLSFGLGGGSVAQEAQILSIRKELEDAKADFEHKLSGLNDVDIHYGQTVDRLDAASSVFARRLDQVDSVRTAQEQRLDRLNTENADFGRKLDRLNSAKIDFERRLARIELSLVPDRLQRDRPPLCECYEWSR